MKWWAAIAVMLAVAVVGTGMYVTLTDRQTWIVTRINPDGSNGAQYIALSYPEESRWGGYRISFPTSNGMVTLPAPFTVARRMEGK